MTASSRIWFGLALAVVGAAFAPVLWGFEPLGGDPELMYQPIKSELARSLATGRLPFWSDRFGLGVPLIAESHVAAFYPLNWIFYRILSVEAAYAVLLWMHAVALAASTFAYARTLQITPPGAAIAAIAFSLCGFQAVHAVHEPFYHLMPYLPLCLLCAHRFVESGKVAWLAGLAVAWGVQLCLGHFQIQMWTAGLVLLTGLWLCLPIPGLGHKISRILGLSLALAWGAAIAWMQLKLTWELTGVAGFARPPQFLANFLFPPAHWAQFALPEVFLGRRQGIGDSYWGHQGTMPGEACAYVGVTPLILAWIGLVAPRDRALAPWRWLAPITLALATMPGWWPDGFLLLLQLPGIGWFRAPARYTLVTSLALALLAGRGVDAAIPARRRAFGLCLAGLFGAGAWAWSVSWSGQAEFRAGLGPDTFPLRFTAAAAAWMLGAWAVLAAWHRPRIVGALVATATVELVPLLYLGPAAWYWRLPLPQSSPVLKALTNLPNVGLVASRLLSLPASCDLTPAFPNLGITPPPPNYLLEAARLAPQTNTDADRLWQRRFGVTHGIWGSRENLLGSGLQIVEQLDDPALDRIMLGVPSAAVGGGSPWRIARYPAPFPPARLGLTVRVASGWGQLYTILSSTDMFTEVWFLAEDNPPSPRGPMAKHAQVLEYDGRKASIEHDGTCVLILQRTYFPGWRYRIDQGDTHPVLKVDGGLQGVLIEGSGITRVELSYHPTGFEQAARISAAALALAACTAIGSLVRRTLDRRRST